MDALPSELVELVLSYACGAALNARRVCRRWRDIVTDHGLLQRRCRLLLLPEQRRPDDNDEPPCRLVKTMDRIEIRDYSSVRGFDELRGVRDVLSCSHWWWWTEPPHSLWRACATSLQRLSVPHGTVYWHHVPRSVTYLHVMQLDMSPVDEGTSGSGGPTQLRHLELLYPGEIWASSIALPHLTCLRVELDHPSWSSEMRLQPHGCPLLEYATALRRLEVTMMSPRGRAFDPLRAPSPARGMRPRRDLPALTRLDELGFPLVDARGCADAAFLRLAPRATRLDVLVPLPDYGLADGPLRVLVSRAPCMRELRFVECELGVEALQREVASHMLPALERVFDGRRWYGRRELEAMAGKYVFGIGFVPNAAKRVKLS